MMESTQVLQYIIDLFSGDDKRCQESLNRHSHLLETCQLLETESYDLQYRNSEDWVAWIAQEGKRRLYYGIWLLDNMLCYHFDRPPSISIKRANLSMPCLESQWDAKTSQEWTESCAQVNYCMLLPYDTHRFLTFQTSRHLYAMHCKRYTKTSTLICISGNLVAFC